MLPLACLLLAACGGGAAESGAAGIPAVQISVLALEFGEQRIGTVGASQAVRIQNSGTVPLEMSKISVSGNDGVSFNLSNDCLAELAPAAICTATLAFAPTSTGPKAAELHLVTNAASNPTVALSGSGTKPAISVNSRSLIFAAQPVDSGSPPQVVTVSNTGTAVLNIREVSLSGADVSSFVESDDCTPSVAPGAACTITVTFAPTAVGTHAAMISISSDADSNPAISLTGSGVAPQPPPPSATGIIPFGSNDPAVLVQSSMTSAASVAEVPGGSVVGSPEFDAIKGLRPDANGGALFQGTYPNTRSEGQLSIEVERTFIAQPSPDAISGGVGGSEGYDHLADGWLQFIDARAADDASIAALGLTKLAAVGGGMYQTTFIGKGVHSAGKSDFVRVTLSWSGNVCELYVDGLLHNSITIPPEGASGRVDIAKIAVGYSPPGSFRVRNFYFRNLVLANRPVNFATHPQLSKVVIYGDSFASQTNPYLIGSTHFDATAGYQLIRDMNNRGMSIGQLLLKDYSGQVLNKSPSAGQASFQLGLNRFGGTDDKLTDVVNANADYVIIMGGTNDATGDAAGRGTVSASFAADLLSMCRAILNNAHTKGVIVQTIMSAKGNAAYASPVYDANVAAINASILALPAVWDSAYAAENGKVKVVDTFTATGGEGAAPNMIKGTLTGALDDLHPAAFASVISANLLADALQEFLTTGAH